MVTIRLGAVRTKADRMTPDAGSAGGGAVGRWGGGAARVEAEG
ncbi:hypothetical protein [Frankia umida]|nr:hypothetical protein [Frankia umida]